MKTIRLYKWPEEEFGECVGCYFHKKGRCKPNGSYLCGSHSILRAKKPEVDFIDVEIEEHAK